MVRNHWSDQGLSREEGSTMARWHFGATKLDRRIAKAVARNTSPAVERPARRSRGELAASLQQRGSSCWRTGRPTCSRAWRWEPWWNGVCGRCPEARTRRTRRRAKRA